MHDPERSWCYAALTLAAILALLPVHRTPPDMHGMPQLLLLLSEVIYSAGLKKGNGSKSLPVSPPKALCWKGISFTSKAGDLQKQQELQETSA